MQWLLISVLLTVSITVRAQDKPTTLPAFPGAQGYGAATPGGRGGKVIAVTSLADKGPGTLRSACDAKGPRTVVFRTGGTIDLKSYLRIREPFLTIAGQTAPGGGICIKGYSVAIQTHDVVVRHLRVRAGDEQGEQLKGSNSDSLEIGLKDGEVYNVVLDHCSFSWAIDENLSTWYPVRDITIQWCIISEALHKNRHEKGPHSMGLLIGDHAHRISVHHNLMACNNYRNPQPKGDTSSQIVNNVIYNWGWSAIPFSDPEKTGPSTADIIGNVFIAGPDSNPEAGCVHLGGDSSPDTRVHLAGNLVEPQWRLVTGPTPKATKQQSDKPLLPASGVTIEPAEKIRDAVLDDAGATRPTRDAVDARVVEQVRTRAGRIIDTQKDVGGWPQLAAGTPALDTDSDSMPDAWEQRNRLNPQQPDDAGDADGDGYTNLEEFLNETDPLVK